jgi:effector-binding domain-containing protein
VTSASYHLREVNIAPRLVAGVHATVQRGKVGREFARYLDQVYAAGRAGSVMLDGQNIFIYRSATPEELTVDFCVGAKVPFAAAGAVVPLYTPGGPAAMTTHHGDYGRIGDANAAIIEWCRANNRRRAGPSWEVYGHWDPDPSKLRTDVYYLLHVDHAAASPVNLDFDTV